jgi:zinc D-Ala-D-Ala carboxypeptidase
MTQLTAHFALEEFQVEKDEIIPPECFPIFTDLAQNILEPVREVFDAPMHITSGYRTVQENRDCHGQATSEHIASEVKCAADFEVEGIGQRFVFDWMRRNPRLPFHQLILESDEKGAAVIHVSINRMEPGVRSVLEGATHNNAPYVRVDHAEYDPEATDG